MAIEPIDETVIELFRHANPKISIDELRMVMRDLESFCGFEANWIILLLIKFKWDIESLRAVLIGRENVNTFIAAAVHTNTARYIRFMLHCAECNTERLFVRADCSHDMCSVCLSLVVMAAMEDDSLPLCTQCEPHKFLNPVFIISMMGPDVCVMYKQSLAKKIDAVHSFQSKATRFLLKHKVAVSGCMLGGVGLLFIIFKIKGIQQAVEDWKVEHPAKGSGIDLAVSMVSQGKDPLKPGNMWEITQTVVKTAWKNYVQKWIWW